MNNNLNQVHSRICLVNLEREEGDEREEGKEGERERKREGGREINIDVREKQ